jgi:hypothetical protein
VRNDQWNRDEGNKLLCCEDNRISAVFPQSESVLWVRLDEVQQSDVKGEMIRRQGITSNMPLKRVKIAITWSLCIGK